MKEKKENVEKKLILVEKNENDNIKIEEGLKNMFSGNEMIEKECMGYMNNVLEDMLEIDEVEEIKNGKENGNVVEGVKERNEEKMEFEKKLEEERKNRGIKSCDVKEVRKSESVVKDVLKKKEWKRRVKKKEEDEENRRVGSVNEKEEFVEKECGDGVKNLEYYEKDEKDDDEMEKF